MVRLADGFITVESRPGHGARFEIYLPREEREAPKTKAPRQVAAGGTVLLVEDDPLVRQVAERVLRRAGWAVHCAESAEAALEVLDRAPCDLMISDVALPGMDGMALARQARICQPAISIILASGYERTVADDGFGAAELSFLAKPYSQEDLLDAVDRTFAN
jgi:two-component system cell cycle sensor histidine kinase/response regulator CckA